MGCRESSQQRQQLRRCACRHGDVKARLQYTLRVSLNYVRHHSNTDSKLTGSVSKSELAADTRSKYAAWPCVP